MVGLCGDEYKCGARPCGGVCCGALPWLPIVMEQRPVELSGVAPV
jgi:hypothetical protein